VAKTGGVCFLNDYFYYILIGITLILIIVLSLLKLPIFLTKIGATNRLLRLTS